MKMTNDFMKVMIDIMSPLNETGELGYAIAYNMRKIADEAKEYLDTQNKLIEKYGKKNENSYSLDPKEDPDAFGSFLNEMGDIPQIEHEVEVLKVSPKTFYSGDLTSQEMANLIWMVDDSKA